jgi:capsular polysaccharide transport system permease protein
MYNSLSLTWRVWRALIFRELQNRLFNSRTSMVWLLLEPLLHLSLIIYIFSYVHIRHIGGLNSNIWLQLGLVTFYFFSWTSSQVSNAISANKSLFAFKQILPFDTMIARAVVEVILLIMIFCISYFFLIVFANITLPVDVLKIINAWSSVWVLGIAWGIFVGIIYEFFSDFAKGLKLINTILYFGSGILVPLSVLPKTFQEIILYNPLVHAIESSRSGFNSHYHTIPNIELSYTWIFAISFVFIAIALLQKFSTKLTAL